MCWLPGERVTSGRMPSSSCWRPDTGWWWWTISSAAIAGRSIPVLFCRISLADTDGLIRVLREEAIDCVMHFAALAYVGESVTEPLTYYDNNTAGSVSLLQAMKQAGVKRMVFSSTCATYGEPQVTPLVETMRQQPINPYGWSKWCVERILRDYGAADRDFSFVALRYFNVAGSAADGSLGEDHTPETHLIPVLLLTAMGLRPKVTVFGTDYPTPDGTCIRDYIHVEDLCAAHIVAMEAQRPAMPGSTTLGSAAAIRSAKCLTRPAGSRAWRFRSSMALAAPATRRYCTPRRAKSAANCAGRPSIPK